MDDDRVEEIRAEVKRILEEGERVRQPESAEDHD